MNPSALEDLWTVVRLAAEGSDWKRDEGEPLVGWAQRTLLKRGADVPRQQWISVKDSLPDESTTEKDNYVLAWFDWKRPPGPRQQSGCEPAERVGGHWRPRGGNGDFDEYVTHWMPMPTSPSNSEERK